MTKGVYPHQNWLAPEWSDEHVAALRRMWIDEGKSAGIIGGILGRTRNAVIGKVHRLDLPVRLGTISGRRKRNPDSNPLRFRKPNAGSSRPKLPAKLKRIRPAEVPPPEARMISLLELMPRDCKWPIGHPGEPGFGFCGAKSFGTFSYCEHHVAMAYVPVAKRGAAPKMPALHSGVMSGSWRQGIAA